MLLPVYGTTAVAQSNPGLELIGTLDTDGRSGGTAGTLVVGINEETRRLYTIGGVSAEERWIAEYDLETEVPTLLRMTEPMLPSLVRAGPSSVVVDEENNRLLMLSPAFADPAKGDERMLMKLDLATLTITDQQGESEILSGYTPMAITYSSDRDRIYLVGTLEGNSDLAVAFSTFATNAPLTVVVALDGQTGAVEWIDHVESCGAPVFSTLTGALVGLSSQRPMLYWFCRAGKTANAPTGQSGLVRLDIEDGADASDRVISDFPSEFFPVSGDYADGTGVFDPDRERFIVQSQSARTHGAWVFDGLRSSWIGFVAAPDNLNVYAGIDPATGKHYMLGGHLHDREDGWVNITDGSATPVPQGRLFADIESPHGDPGVVVPQSDAAIDSETGRLFLGVSTETAEVNQFGTPIDRYYWVVLRDTVPPITPREPLDLDELTHNLADDKARLEFSANTSGFGAQYIMIGGWEGVYENIYPPFVGSGFAPSQLVHPNPAQIRYGNRGATMAFVDSMGIASSGSSATAIATRPDENTPADAETKAQQATDPVGGVPEVPEDGEADGEPVSHASCLDGIGEPMTTERGSEEQPAYAVVTCDLATLETSGQAKFSDRTGGGPMSVGSSSFDGHTYRDDERGVVSEAVATAEGIAFGEVGVGGVTVDRVTSTVTTWAKGLDGASHVRWERTVEGARTVDADGTVSEGESCTTIVESGKETVEEGDCKSLAQDLNDLFPNRYEVKFPLPEVVATPGGAFASVQETETDFLSGKATNNDQLRAIPGMEVTVYRDGPQRGRLVTQLAAVKADATFIRTLVPQFQPFSAAGSTGDVGASPTDGQSTGTDQSIPEQSTDVALPLPSDDSGAGVEDPDIFVSASHQERLVGAFGWLPALRSLGDAVLTGALYLVFLLPLLEVVRRRRLLGVLVGDEPTDASGIRPSHP